MLFWISKIIIFYPKSFEKKQRIWNYFQNIISIYKCILGKSLTSLAFWNKNTLLKISILCRLEIILSVALHSRFCYWKRKRTKKPFSMEICTCPTLSLIIHCQLRIIAEQQVRQKSSTSILVSSLDLIPGVQHNE